MQGFCKPQSSAQARKEAPDFNGVRSIKVMSWFVKPPKRGQYPSYTPIFNGLVVKMDISHNTTNVEFGVQVPTRLPFLISAHVPRIRRDGLQNRLGRFDSYGGCQFMVYC